MTLEFKCLTPENFCQFEQEILNSERVFHENLREDGESLRETASCRGYTGLVAILDGKYIGNIQGFSPTQEDIEEMELLGLKEDVQTIYIGNYVIEPEFQGRGFGSQLLFEMVKVVKDRGYKRVEGHFRGGVSLNIAKKAGAEEIKIYSDWFETGEGSVTFFAETPFSLT